MENSFGGPGLRLPNQNFGNNGFNNPNNNGFNKGFSNNYGGNGNENSPTPFTSLDGRKWTTKDQEFRANQEYYRDFLGGKK